jgi:hypothetical protein
VCEVNGQNIIGLKVGGGHVLPGAVGTREAAGVGRLLSAQAVAPA